MSSVIKRARTATTFFFILILFIEPGKAIIRCTTTTKLLFLCSHSTRVRPLGCFALSLLNQEGILTLFFWSVGEEKDGNRRRRMKNALRKIFAVLLLITVFAGNDDDLLRAYFRRQLCFAGSAGYCDIARGRCCRKIFPPFASKRR